MQGNILGQSAGININGIIEEYKVAAGEKVKAGDFVEFVNQFYGEKELSSDVQVGTYGLCVVKLSENKVLIAYNSNVGLGAHLHAMAVTLENNDVITGVETVIDEQKDSGKRISAVALNEGSAFLSYIGSNNLNIRKLIFIDMNNNIEVKHTNALSNTTTYLSTVSIENNKVFSAFNSGAYVYGRIDMIEDDEIKEVVSSTILASVNGATNNVVSSVLLSNDGIFIAHTYGENNLLYGTYCLLGETDITTVESTAIGSEGVEERVEISAVKLKENTVLVTGTFSLRFALFGVVCSIDENNIVSGICTQLISAQEYEGIENICGFRFSDFRAFIMYEASEYTTTGQSGKFIYGLACTINNQMITIDRNNPLRLKTGLLTGSQYAFLMSENTIFLIYNSNLNVTLYQGPKVEKLKNRYNNILGIAKTSGNSGQVIKVVAPNYYDEREEI